MRRILVEAARRKGRLKHGSGLGRLSLDGLAAARPDDDLPALDEALERLAAEEPEAAAVVKLTWKARVAAAFSRG
jgi:hypothetical protein